MLTENGKNALPEPIVKRLDEINALCLETMGKRIKEIGELSPSDAHKLARQLKLGADVRKIEHELSKATALSVADIEKIFEIVANDNVETAKAMLEAGGTVIPYAENKELQRWVSALAKQTEQELINLAKTTAFMRYDENGNKVLTSLSKTYNDVIDKAVASASSGVVDYKTAMRKTLKDLADSGLRTKYKKLEGSAGPTVDYASGYSRRLDTAVRQNILWGIKECNLGVQEQIGEEFNADGYEIDYHRNPRPSHAEMGGKQYVKGKARYIKGKYYESFEAKAEPLLAEYGCLHFKFPIICGISRPIYSDEELAKLKAEDNKTFEYEGKTYTGYEAKQMQRKLETAIRHAKDRQKIAKAAGDDTLRRQEQKKLNDLTRKYKDFSEKAGLSVKKDRMSVSGYHRVKPLDNGGGSGIMNPVEYDSLSSLFKADSILESEIKTLDDVVSVIPEKHLSAIKEHISSIEIIKSRGYSSYSPKTRTVYLNDETKNNDIIHELGHVLADVYNIYDDDKFLSVLSDNLPIDSWYNVLTTTHPNESKITVYFLKSPKFLNNYQGRIYFDSEFIDYSEPIPLKSFQEYFSVGFDAFFNNADMLKEKDYLLYKYIEEMLMNE
ncbi:MAG: phage minor capsid protein [Oscillospiraceae bacterium]